MLYFVIMVIKFKALIVLQTMGEVTIGLTGLKPHRKVKITTEFSD